ncbi:DUF5708 family protein [Saccharomonospora viridis]|uniref:DUF5708 family protein n=1 Tax=Saccharomonospora viridis TaxID=1852 RepID=UPI002409E1AC|nr:DUF5708 family protein [Saccharomonospora viridis]
MSANVKSLFIGASMLAIGLALAFTAGDVETPIFDLDKVGVVLAVLGGIELLITGGMMVLPSKSKKLERD